MENKDIEALTASFQENGMHAINTQLAQYEGQGDARLKVLDSIRQSINPNQSLDRMQEIYEACIVEALSIAGTNNKLIDYANVTSYNLSANLADCWDDAIEPRTNAHFNAGISAANRCLELRKQLDKPPIAMAMAYFILGVHEYSLQHYSKAEAAWKKKLENENLGHTNPTDADSDLNILLSHGLIALARWSLGVEDTSNYNKSLTQLEAERNTENTNEVDLFISELVLLKEKHGPSDLQS